jgi:hypothetical protein
MLVNLCIMPQLYSAEEMKMSATELAKKSQNPIAHMMSVPMKYNTYFNTGPDNRTQNILRIQPVLPFRLDDDWNFIARPTIPFLEQPPMNDMQSREYGLGNIQFQGFLSPNRKFGGWRMGFGPFFEFPTNTQPDGRFGSDNWSVGPTYMMMQMTGPWVFGGMVTQLWSFAGSDDEVNMGTIQPFVNYNFEGGWYVSSSPIISVDWSAASKDQWTIPVGGGFGKVFRIGEQAINASVKAYKNVVSPTKGSDWQLQLQVQLLF